MPRSLFAGVILAGSALALSTASSAVAQATDTRTPEAIAIQTGIEQVCVPRLGHHGQSPPASAALRHDDNGAFVPVNGSERLRIILPDSVNPTVCTMSLNYPDGQRKGMLALLDAWSAAHHLKPVRISQMSRGPDGQRWTSTWEGQSPRGEMAIAFSADQPLSAATGKPAPNLATIEVSLSPRSS
jgi:hypothetical protein